MNVEVTLADQITITIDGNDYVAKFPHVGEEVRIEALKELYSNKTYSSLLQNLTKSSQRVLDIVDMMAYFTVMIPDLQEDLDVKNVKTFNDLPQIKAIPLVNAYKQQLRPWLDDWYTLLGKLENPKEEDKFSIDETQVGESDQS